MTATVRQTEATRRMLEQEAAPPTPSVVEHDRIPFRARECNGRDAARAAGRATTGN